MLEIVCSSTFRVTVPSSVYRVRLAVARHTWHRMRKPSAPKSGWIGLSRSAPRPISWWCFLMPVSICREPLPLGLGCNPSFCRWAMTVRQPLSSRQQPASLPRRCRPERFPVTWYRLMLQRAMRRRSKIRCMAAQVPRPGVIACWAMLMTWIIPVQSRCRKLPCAHNKGSIGGRGRWFPFPWWRPSLPIRMRRRPVLPRLAHQRHKWYPPWLRICS